MLKKIILVLITFSMASYSENDSRKVELRLNDMSDSIANMRIQLQNEKIANDSLMNEIRINNEIAIKDHNKLHAEIRNIEVGIGLNAHTSKIGAFILLLGLLIEIVGGTLLTGSHLAAKQKDVMTLMSTPPLVDLALNDVNNEPRQNFLGVLASGCIFIGFVLQFTGTLVVFSFPWYMNIGFVLLATIPGAFILYYLLGQSFDQSRTEKLKIVFGNIKRCIPEINGVRCQICNKKYTMTDSSVFWLQETVSKEYPYLHEPYHFRLGHTSCLEMEFQSQLAKVNRSYAQVNIYKTNLIAFKNTKIQELEKWWNDKLIFDKNSHVGFHENEFKRIAKKTKVA